MNEDGKQEQIEPKPTVEMVKDVKVIRFEWNEDQDDEWMEAYKAFRKSGRIRGCK